MSQTRLELHDDYGTLTIDRPRANAIGVEMVSELLERLDEAEAAGIRALVLTGTNTIFSAGLDVPALAELDREAMTAFWEDFNHLCARLYTTDLMTVAAINGHSPAGGCVLAILCDYRIMAAGPYKIGLNEVGVGIPIPGGLTEVYAALLGQRVAEDMGCRGALVSPEQAAEIGLVDQVVEAKLLQAATLERIARWLSCGREAQIATKHLFRRHIARSLTESAEVDRQLFLDQWFAPPAQKILGDLVARLKG